MTMSELSFLLWCTQGVKKLISGYVKYIKDGSGRNYLLPVATRGCIPIKPFSKQFYIKDPDGFEIDLIQWTNKKEFYNQLKRGE